MWVEELNVRFRRNLGEVKMVEWVEMTKCLGQTQVIEGFDSPIWKLENNGNFTARSIYRAITFG